ncbi:uncharacterized protein TNCV_2184651 [Trichonephila clavipes]|nr:uncharacterized protein TNCV_2184651 [Trichonephila clavipes]
MYLMQILKTSMLTCSHSQRSIQHVFVIVNHSCLQERQCLQTTIFMQDGATSIICRQVKALLSANFGLNSDYFPGAWPSRSPNLNPRDFWLRRFLKDRVCRGGIRTLPDLKASSIRHLAEIPRELLRATFENAKMRFQQVIDVSGAHIEHIL